MHEKPEQHVLRTLQSLLILPPCQCNSLNNTFISNGSVESVNRPGWVEQNERRINWGIMCLYSQIKRRLDKQRYRDAKDNKTKLTDAWRWLLLVQGMGNGNLMCFSLVLLCWAEKNTEWSALEKYRTMKDTAAKKYPIQCRTDTNKDSIGEKYTGHSRKGQRSRTVGKLHTKQQYRKGWQITVHDRVREKWTGHSNKGQLRREMYRILLKQAQY